jgi:hypothetical protein
VHVSKFAGRHANEGEGAARPEVHAKDRYEEYYLLNYRADRVLARPQVAARTQLRVVGVVPPRQARPSTTACGWMAVISS